MNSWKKNRCFVSWRRLRPSRAYLDVENLVLETTTSTAVEVTGWHHEAQQWDLMTSSTMTYDDMYINLCIYDNNGSGTSRKAWKSRTSRKWSRKRRKSSSILTKKSSKAFKKSTLEIAILRSSSLSVGIPRTPYAKERKGWRHVLKQILAIHKKNGSGVVGIKIEMIPWWIQEVFSNKYII